LGRWRDRPVSAALLAVWWKILHAGGSTSRSPPCFSLVVPTILMGGPVEVFAAIVVVIVSLRTGSLPAAMVTGVGTVLALRALQANLL